MKHLLFILFLLSAFVVLTPRLARAVCWCTPDGLGCVGGPRPPMLGTPGGTASAFASFYLFPSDAWPRCVKQTAAAAEAAPAPRTVTTTRTVVVRQVVVEKPETKKPAAGIPWCTADCELQTELE